LNHKIGWIVRLSADDVIIQCNHMHKHPLKDLKLNIFMHSKLQVFESLEGLNSSLAHSDSEL